MSRLTERHVVPSILSADFSRLGAQVGEVLAAGARVIHVDVMDGHFVPPITFGAVAVGAIADQVHAAGGIVDVHLMIERPERQVADIARAGADSITVHIEATPHLHYALAAIREAGAQRRAAICPATPADVPGRGRPGHARPGAVHERQPRVGQPGPSSPPRIDKLARMRAALPDRVGLEVDGGIHDATVAPAVEAGANLLVAGSAVFGAPDPGEAYRALGALAGSSEPPAAARLAGRLARRVRGRGSGYCDLHASQAKVNRVSDPHRRRRAGRLRIEQSSSGVSASAYVKSVCGAVIPFEQDVLTRSAAINPTSIKSAAQGKQVLHQFLSAISDDTSTAVSKLQSAGSPSVSNGKQIASAILGAFKRLKTTMVSATSQSSSLSTSQPAGVRVGHPDDHRQRAHLDERDRHRSPVEHAQEPGPAEGGRQGGDLQGPRGSA